jgi:hypothetical protein
MERMNHRSVGIRLGLLLFAIAIVPVACFKGADRDKQAPPGNPGGLCLAPDGHCTKGECNQSENYCFDRANPCSGFFCGGADRGLCQVTSELQPSCTCAVGFNNDQFALYCCPDDELADPDCAPVGPMDGDDDGGGETTDDGSSESDVG